MGVIAHSFPIPEGMHYDFSDESILGDLTDFENLEIDEIWYWYAQGSYDGSGSVIMRKGDLWDVDGLSHCS